MCVKLCYSCRRILLVGEVVRQYYIYLILMFASPPATIIHTFVASQSYRRPVHLVSLAGFFCTARALIRFNPAREDVKILHTTDCWQTFLPSFGSFFLLVLLGYVCCCWLLALTLLSLVGHRHGHVLFMLSAICHHGKHKLYYHQNEKSFLALWYNLNKFGRLGISSNDSR